MENQPSQQEAQAPGLDQRNFLRRGLDTARQAALRGTRATGDFARRNAKAAIAASLFSLPLAATAGFALDETHDLIGPAAVTIKPNLEGETVVKTGLIDGYFPMIAAGPVGATITTDGIVGDVDGNSLENFKYFFENSGEYAKNVEKRLIDNAIDIGLVTEGALVLGGTLYLRKHPEQIRRLGIRVVIGTTLLTMAAGSDVAMPVQHSDQYTLTTLDGTPLQGSRVSNASVGEKLDEILPTYEKLKDRVDNNRKAYVTSILADENEQEAKICPEIPNTIKMTVISDVHAALTVPSIVKPLVDQCQSDYVTLSGDVTDSGSGPEIAGLKNLVAIAPSPDQLVAIEGDHDPNTVGKALKAAGATVLDGKTVRVEDKDGDSLSFAGDPDPTVNKPFSSDEYKRDPANPISEEDLGKQAYERDVKDHPDVRLEHEPGVEAGYLKAAGNNPLPVKFYTWGHMHKPEGPDYVRNADGSSTLLYQSGTTGGKGETTLLDAWLYFSAPNATATASEVWLDKTTHEVVGFQQFAWSAAPRTVLTVGKQILYGTPSSTTEPTSIDKKTTRDTADRPANKQTQESVSKSRHN